jgi:hypothetical protein
MGLYPSFILFSEWLFHGFYELLFRLKLFPYAGTAELQPYGVS